MKRHVKLAIKLAIIDLTRNSTYSVMSIRQLAILDFLDFSPATMTEISENLKLNKAAVSRSLERLKQWNFVDFETSTEDKRRIQITLTHDAKEFLREFCQ